MNKEQMFELFLCTFDIGIILILNYKLIEQQFRWNKIRKRYEWKMGIL